MPTFVVVLKAPKFIMLNASTWQLLLEYYSILIPNVDECETFIKRMNSTFILLIIMLG